MAVSGSPWSNELVLRAKSLADATGAPWIALHVLSHTAYAGAAARERARSALELAENLGAEIVTVRGEHPATDILSVAKSRGVTKIVMGRESDRPRLRRLFKPSLVDTIVNDPDGIDVYLVRAEKAGEKPPSGLRNGRRETSGKSMPPLRFVWTAAFMIASLALSMLLDRFGAAEANIIMVHLLGAFLASLRTGPLAALATVSWAVLQFNFFFTQPRFTFAVYDVGYLPVFAIMLVVGTVSASLAARLRRQTEITRRQEAQTYQLYLLGQALAATKNEEEMLYESCERLSQIYEMDAAIFLPDQDGKLSLRARSSGYDLVDEDNPAIEQCYAEGKPVNTVSPHRSKQTIRCAPIQPDERIVGVAALLRRNSEVEPPESMHLNTALSLIGRAIDRERLLVEQRRASVYAETERVRSSLLRSVSHDLRTPLSGIAGAAEALRYGSQEVDAVSAAAQDIETEAHRLSLLVENILNLTRLQEDPTKLRRSRESADDIIDSVTEVARNRYRNRKIGLRFSETPQVIEVDPVLIQQLLLNYVDNADKYSPPDAPIELSTLLGENEISLIVTDRGEGIEPAARQVVFDKFVRGRTNDDRTRGSGLGLYICKTIAHAHGGTVFVEPAEGGGSCFGVRLPVVQTDLGVSDA